MAFWNEIGNRLAWLFRRSRFDRELEEEMRFHIQARADELEQAGLHRRRCPAASAAGVRFHAAEPGRDALGVANALAGGSRLRSPLCGARVAAESCPGAGGGWLAGFGNRRQHHHLQRRQGSALQRTLLPRSAVAGADFRERQHLDPHAAISFPGGRARIRRARRDEHPDGGELARRQPFLSPGGNPRHRQLLRGDGNSSRHGAAHRARRIRCRGDYARVLDQAPGRRSERGRPHTGAGRQAVHRGRSIASRPPHAGRIRFHARPVPDQGSHRGHALCAAAARDDAPGGLCPPPADLPRTGSRVPGCQSQMGERGPAFRGWRSGAS